MFLLSQKKNFQSQQTAFEQCSYTTKYCTPHTAVPCTTKYCTPHTAVPCIQIPNTTVC